MPSAVLLALALLAPPAKAPRVAVLDVRLSPGIDASYGGFLTQVLASEVGEKTGQAPLTSGDVTALLGLERQKALLGCGDSQSCLAEIGGALGVEQVIYATVAQGEGRYLVTMSRLDTRRALPIARATDLADRTPEALVACLRRLVAQVYGAAPALHAEAPVEPASGQWKRTGRWIFAGAALGLVAGGAYLGSTALTAAEKGDADTALPRAHAADALYVGAALSAGLAVWTFVTAPSSPPPVAVGIAPSPGGALIAVGGSF